MIILNFLQRPIVKKILVALAVLFAIFMTFWFIIGLNYKFITPQYKVHLPEVVVDTSALMNSVKDISVVDGKYQINSYDSYFIITLPQPVPYINSLNINSSAHSDGLEARVFISNNGDFYAKKAYEVDINNGSNVVYLSNNINVSQIKIQIINDKGA
ncbi:MAG: hypothetical protein LBV09_08095, partial [Deferribacteraceae bacterium]|nr:hypothetical protein [Deferribacteraceae bacterium]